MILVRAGAAGDKVLHRLSRPGRIVEAADPPAHGVEVCTHPPAGCRRTSCQHKCRCWTAAGRRRQVITVPPLVPSRPGR